MSNVTITLSSVVSAEGVDVDKLTMREPKVIDQLTMDEIKGSEAEKEVGLFANLCDVTVDTIKELYLKDYKKLQEALVNFTK